MEVNKINGFVYSKIIEGKFNKKVIPTELQFLNFIKQERRITEKEFSEKFNISYPIVNDIFISLSKKNLIEQNSSEWKVTSLGQEILKFCEGYAKKIDADINSDSCLSELSLIA